MDTPTIYFYSDRERPYRVFSNFSKHGFVVNGKFYKTSEHYFQSQKFVGTEFEETVRLAPSPKAAADLGRNRKLPLREDWEQVKEEVMRTALRAKFAEHKELA